MINAPSSAQISLEILHRSKLVRNKDGSQGLDVLASLHQYHLAYASTRQFVPQNSTVLDWGGGSGHFAYFLNRTGYKANIFSFFDPQFIQEEVEEKQIAFTLADSNQPVALPYADNTFDAVFSIGVLEHVRETGGNERDSLAEIHRILKPGGIFICFHLPNSGSWIEWVAAKLDRYHHQYTYNAKNVEDIFKDRLTIIDKRRYALFPRNSLRLLPAGLANSTFFCSTFSFLDRWVARCLPWINQNWLIIAKKIV